MDVTRPRRASWSLGRHLLVLLGLLVVLTAVIERRSGFTVDEGSYAIQAEALHDGTWEAPWPFLASDPEGRHLPYGSLSSHGELVIHPRQAAWPAALSVTGRWLPEEVGLRLLPLAGVVGGAAVAFALGSRLGGARAGAWAFWMAVASPLLPNGTMLWAHAPEVALAGLATLALVEITRARVFRGGWVAVLAGALASLVLIRSEGLIFAGAAVAVLGLAGLVRRSWPVVVAASLAGAASLTGHLLDRRWAAAILGSDEPSRIRSRDHDGGSWLGGRLRATTTSLVGGAFDDPALALWSLATVAVLALAVVEVLRPAPRFRLDVLLAAATALLAIRWVLGFDAPVPGLLTAWPVALLAVLGAWQVERSDARVVLGVVALFAVGVLLTQDDSAGGMQWGGRYLSPVIVPLAALAATALHHRSLGGRAAPAEAGAMGVTAAVGPGAASAGGGAVPAEGGAVAEAPGTRPAAVARGARPALAALVVVGGLMGPWITNEVRSGNAEAMERVAALDAEVVLTGGDYLGRLDWRGWPERCWVAVRDDLGEALDVLRRAGVARVAYIGIAAEDLRAEALDPEPDGPRSLIGTFDLAPEPGSGTGAPSASGCPAP